MYVEDFWNWRQRATAQRWRRGDRLINNYSGRTAYVLSDGDMLAIATRQGLMLGSRSDFQNRGWINLEIQMMTRHRDLWRSLTLPIRLAEVWRRVKLWFNEP